jgi:hypothetical protein
MRPAASDPRNPEETGYGKDRQVSQVSSPTNNLAVLGTLYIIGAQVIFAVVNFVYDVLTNPWNPLLADDKMT